MGTIPFHTLCLTLYFPLFLYSQNIHRFTLSVVAVPTLCLLAVTAFLGWVLFYALKNAKMAAVFLSLNLILLFTYGYTFGYLRDFLLDHSLARMGANKILVATWLMANVVCIVAIHRNRERLNSLTQGMNTLSLILLAIPILSCFQFMFTNRSIAPLKSAGDIENLTAAFLKSDTAKHKPDIYHIVMDAYSRADVLQDAYGFDNEDFLKSLREKGFRIGSQSYANYSYTDLSMASMLNLNYLDTLLSEIPTHSRNWKNLDHLRDNAKAIQVLKRIGYRFIAIPHGWENAPPPLADVVLAPTGSMQGFYLNEYQNGLLAMTPIPRILNAFRPGMGDKDTQHRNRITFAFNALEDVHLEKGPKYVYCHILAPHFPIVFGPEGEPVSGLGDFHLLRKQDPSVLVQSVTGEIRYLNKKLENVIKNILSASNGDAIIILQSDHGESVLEPEETGDFYRQRHGILAAIYLPKRMDSQEFYASMTPVNFFRYVFNSVFGLDFEILKDRVYFSPTHMPFRVEEITDRLLHPPH